MNTLSKEAGISPAIASWAEVDEEDADQRIDNFLVRTLKGVPRSHLYRLLRTGQVRVNSRRVDATYRLQAGDRVRLPPVKGVRPGRRRTGSGTPQPQNRPSGGAVVLALGSCFFLTLGISAFARRIQ